MSYNKLAIFLLPTQCFARTCFTGMKDKWYNSFDVHSMASTTSLEATELFLLAVHSYVPSSSYWMLSISTTRLKSLYLVRSGILPPTFLQENPQVWA